MSKCWHNSAHSYEIVPDISLQSACCMPNIETNSQTISEILTRVVVDKVCDFTLHYLHCLKVSWCFKPSQPQMILSGLKETFIKRYTVERASGAETIPEGQSEKAESCRENLWNEIQLKRPERQKQAQELNKKGVGKLSWFMSKTYNCNISTM